MLLNKGSLAAFEPSQGDWFADEVAVACIVVGIFYIVIMSLEGRMFPKLERWF